MREDLVSVLLRKGGIRTGFDDSSRFIFVIFFFCTCQVLWRLEVCMLFFGDPYLTLNLIISVLEFLANGFTEFDS